MVGSTVYQAFSAHRAGDRLARAAMADSPRPLGRDAWSVRSQDPYSSEFVWEIGVARNILIEDRCSARHRHEVALPEDVQREDPRPGCPGVCQRVVTRAEQVRASFHA